jgi:hypothetical protein
MDGRCVVGKYGGEYVDGEWQTQPEKYQCGKPVRSKEGGKNRPSLCAFHQETFARERHLYESDIAAEKVWTGIQPSEKCRECGDYTMCPGLGNKTFCSTCTTRGHT